MNHSDQAPHSRLKFTFLNNVAANSQALGLLEELGAALKHITGDDGSQNAELGSFSQKGAAFVLAMLEGEPVGCGGYRPLDQHRCEIKRMYAAQKGRGIGNALCQKLEDMARREGYSSICLSTRVINQAAINFYLKRNYKPIENYGAYAGMTRSVCFQKVL
ncbi:GNAT family N-acetyltransferase [Flexibacterium corallicola]|uniref:GNAT family N-acetyltransferase n=1 Tax=Flexibacterium corallicola TaxID=3037259 RepID=UPI00286EF35B|nr:GNAT family N-acetyltransferase [Pseudovibrio sp. M1P-2-3]